MNTEKEIILEHNGEKWSYCFGKLTVQQIFSAQSWFVFYGDIITNPPPSAKQLKMTGAADYLHEALSLILLEIKDEKTQPFNPEETPKRAAKFLSSATGLYEKTLEIQKDFFLRTKISSVESIMKSKNQMQATGVLLSMLTRGEKTQ